MTDLQALLERLEVKLSVALVGYMPGGDWPHFEWRATLSRGDRSFTTAYKTGVGHVRPMPTRWLDNLPEHERPRRWLEDYRAPLAPTPASVAASLMSDAGAGLDTFAGYCSEFDLDTDSRRALDTYLACQAALTAMRRMFGEHFHAVADAAQAE